MKASKGAVITAYAIVYFVWGSTFFFIHKALSDFTPFVLGSLRFIFASILLMTYCKMKGYKLFSPTIVRQACTTGFLLLFLDMAALIWAEQYISSGIAAIMAAATALWFVILDKKEWKNNFSNISIILGLVAGFVGVIMLFAEQVQISGNPSSRMRNLFCMGLLLFGGVTWATGSLYSKYSAKKNSEKEKQPEELHTMVKTAWQFITAGVLFTAVALLNGEYRAFQPTEVSAQGWFSVGYLITFGSIMAYGAYIWLIQVRPTTEVSTYAYINPIVAVILSYFFANDVVTGLQIGGLLVILLSVLLMNWNLYKNARFLRIAHVRWYHFRHRRVYS
ncbi:EamA family transporter [Elizabethkingia sp. JS20170427COW]|uniref:EamA family transporter n=1 Tax=Elizabethkingia sp. JS20170427COW TaxID=2583851 RepID=UPI001110D306|nr:EamA family transporter [Elizabethkingia sp. JS20170427COW]QCX54220.1 EamA family transporter [Elizabethkingia sp. JS20170427COW]